MVIDRRGGNAFLPSVKVGSIDFSVRSQTSKPYSVNVFNTQPAINSFLPTTNKRRTFSIDSQILK